MQVIIEIKEKITKLILKDQEELIDEIIFTQEENISQKLLPFFDGLLKRNRLKKENISKVVVDTDLGDSYTSRRIAEAFANSFNDFKKSLE